MTLISKEQAAKEINSWLDFLSIDSDQKQKLDQSIQRLITAVCNGHIEIDQTNFNLTQKLIKPVGKEVVIKELVFKPNIVAGDLHTRLIGVNPEDTYANIYAYICASTGENKEVIAKMDMKDYRITDSIVVFFMV